MAQLGFASPGVAAPIFSQNNQFIWGGPRAEIVTQEFSIDASSVDAGSNNTKVLRAGLALGRVTATGKLKQFDNAAVDGTQNLVGFLQEETPLIDTFGRSQEAFAPVVIKAPVKAKEILVLGVKFQGSANDVSGVRTKIRDRFFLDDEV